MTPPRSPKFLKDLCCFKGSVEPADSAGGDVSLDEVHQDVRDVQPIPVPTIGDADAPSSDLVAPPEVKQERGHTRMRSEAREATPLPAKVPTPKVSRCGSSASSHQSSASVLTAIERELVDRIPQLGQAPQSPGCSVESDKESLPDRVPPGKEQRYSTDSVETAIETPSSPVKKDDGGSSPDGATSSKDAINRGMGDIVPEDASTIKKENEDSKESKEITEEGIQSPKNDREEAGRSQKDNKESANEDSKESTPEPLELPAGVKTLDDLRKLNELLDGDKFDLKNPFWDKISLFYGDITKIQVDAIVNAANAPLAGGGGVDGAIHSAAGHAKLQAECKKHARPVPTGEAVMTASCNLSTHVKKIIHCVGPVCYGGVTSERRQKLLSCYRRAIQISEENGLRSIAFCCISTGIYGYDNKDAANTVIRFLWKYLSKEENAAKWDRIVLCLFMEIDKKCYKHDIVQLAKNSKYFDDEEEDDEGENEDDDDEEEKDKKKKEKKGDADDGKEKKEDKKEKREKKDDETAEKKDKKEDKMEESSTALDSNENDKAAKGDCVAEKIEDKKEGEEADVEGEGLKTDNTPATTSASDTSTGEKEEDGERKEEGEKENNEIDGNVRNEEGIANMKRGISEDKEEQPPIKRDKIERESAV